MNLIGLKNKIEIKKCKIKLGKKISKIKLKFSVNIRHEKCTFALKFL